MYARALFQAAREEGRLERVAADLGELARALDDVPELRALLRNPQIDPSEKAALLDQLVAGGDELVRNFVQLVSEKGRARAVSGMGNELQAVVARQQNRLALQ